MKTALVTSSTKGVGKAIGLKLLQEGYYVFFNYCNDDENAKLLRDDLSKNFYNKFEIIKSDLSSIDGVNVLCDYIKQNISNLDCIVLTTGITCYKEFQEITVNDWNKVLNTNLTMPFFVLKGLDGVLSDNGRIIFISSILGDIPHGRSIPYAVSKSGLNMLSKSLVKVYASRKITVNTIAVGFVDTEWHNTKTPEHISRIKNKTALKRLGDTEEIALLCNHIVENEYINGAIINIDGGYDMI